nr:hypothetical protein [Apium graveolens]
MWYVGIIKRPFMILFISRNKQLFRPFISTNKKLFRPFISRKKRIFIPFISKNKKPSSRPEGGRKTNGFLQPSSFFFIEATLVINRLFFLLLCIAICSNFLLSNSPEHEIISNSSEHRARAHPPIPFFDEESNKVKFDISENIPILLFLYVFLEASFV